VFRACGIPAALNQPSIIHCSCVTAAIPQLEDLQKKRKGRPGRGARVRHRSPAAMWPCGGACCKSTGPCPESCGIRPLPPRCIPEPLSSVIQTRPGPLVKTRSRWCGSVDQVEVITGARIRPGCLPGVIFGTSCQATCPGARSTVELARAVNRASRGRESSSWLVIFPSSRSSAISLRPGGQAAAFPIVSAKRQVGLRSALLSGTAF